MPNDNTGAADRTRGAGEIDGEVTEFGSRRDIAMVRYACPLPADAEGDTLFARVRHALSEVLARAHAAEGRVDELERENATLRADAELLDYLQRWALPISVEWPLAAVRPPVFEVDGCASADLRAAIGAAARAGRPAGEA
jgi:hypothetical protein